MRALCISLLLCACDPGVDVVARTSKGGSPSLTKNDEGTASTALTCETPTMLAFITKGGELHRVDMTKMKTFASTTLDCLQGYVTASAITSTGSVWATVDGTLVVIDAASGVCKSVTSGFAATALAFGWSLVAGRDVLYAVIDDTLVEMDTADLQPKKLGKMPIPDVRNLATDETGRLLAFGGDALVTIARLDPTDASLLATWQVKGRGDGAKFLGGAPLASGNFELVFGTDAFLFDPAQGTMTTDVSLFAADPGLLIVATPPCALAGK